MFKLASFWQLLVAICLSSCLFTKFSRADEADLQAITALHFNEAAGYSMFLDETEKMPLELQKQPIFKWQNVTDFGQLGAVYVWTRAGRPEVVGTIFSQPEDGKRVVVHEFHTLSDKILTIRSPENVMRHWTPRGTLTMKVLQNAPAVADTPAQRMFQMRTLARNFSAYTKGGGERVELRLAPQPMIRYQPTRTDVLDGALFAFLSSAAGTDPEVILQIEARKTGQDSDDWTWTCGIIRFCDRDLVVFEKDVELFSSIANTRQRAKIEDNYTWTHNTDDTYFVFRAKVVSELTKSHDKP